MTDTPDFDAADLAMSILDLDDPADHATTSAFPSAKPASSSNSSVGSSLGWVLFAALSVAVSVAISMAVQMDAGADPTPTPGCTDLASECCVTDDFCDPKDCDLRTRSFGQHEGLFDAEERFADQEYVNNC